MKHNVVVRFTEVANSTQKSFITYADGPVCQAARRQAIASAHARFSKRTARKKIRIHSTQVDNVRQYLFLPLLAWPFGLWIGSR